MAEEDFNPTEQTVEITQWPGATVRGTFHPVVGSKIAVVYIEATPANAAAINAKLAEVEALSTRFTKKVWSPWAKADCRPAMHIRATAQVDAPVAEE